MLNQYQEQNEYAAPLALVERETAVSTQIAAAQILTRQEMVALQKRLVSKDKTISGQAEQQLALMDSAALTSFIAFERQNRKRNMKAAGISLVALYALIIAISIFTRQHGLFGMFGAFTSIMVGAAAFSGSYKSGVIALTRLENSESIGELISALEIQDKDVQQVVRPALIRMLPKLRASDAKLLSDASRHTMRKFLQGKLANKPSHVVKTVPGVHGVYYRVRSQRIASYEDVTQLRIAMLNALRQVGDSSFIDIVESIATGSGPLSSRRTPEVVAAASECLPYLRQRAVEAIASNELVRPSNANSVGGVDTLVRPVLGTQEMHEEQLLRAGEAPK